MAWWGKVLGGTFGLMLGGPLGALLGAAMGHGLDRGVANLKNAQDIASGDPERVQMAFFTATFSVMGHIAKADGRVCEQEIAIARAVMQRMELNEAMRSAAIDLFTQGKQPEFNLDEVLEQFRRECHGRRTLIQLFLEIQLQAALADGQLDPVEEQLLLHICRRLHYPRLFYEALKRATYAGQRHSTTRPSAETLQAAYALLNLTPEASEAEIKRAYRRLLSQHHPDKLVAKGLPEEMIKIASQRTHEIRQAYERIKQERDF